MSDFLIYIHYFTSGPEKSIKTFVFARYLDGKIIWEEKEETAVSNYGQIFSGDIIFEDELVTPRNISREFIAFIKDIAPRIATDEALLRTEFNNGIWPGDCKIRAESYVNTFAVVSGKLRGFIEEYDTINRIGGYNRN